MSGAPEESRTKTPPAARRPYDRDIWAERYGDFVPVRVEDIFWVEAERDYVRLHTADASFLLRETISNMEARLDPDMFIRIRRSAMVRRDRIALIRRPGYRDYRVQLTNAAELRAGRTYIRQIRAMIAAR
jgi:DNA-binding LytR/AlgR family response regulator